MVIPIIADVITPVEFKMPDVENIDWNENGVELMTLVETERGYPDGSHSQRHK